MCIRPANERRRYIITSSLIGWAHKQNDPPYTWDNTSGKSKFEYQKAPHHSVKCIRRLSQAFMFVELLSYWYIYIIYIIYYIYININKDSRIQISNVPSHRRALTKLLTSSHRLRCETRRWERPVVPYENRMCLVCLDKIGDEFHFLLECPRHQSLRSRLIGRYYWNRPSMLKLQQLLNSTCTKVIRAVGKFVYKAFNDLWFYVIHVCGFLYMLIPRCYTMLLYTPCWSVFVQKDVCTGPWS